MAKSKMFTDAQKLLETQYNTLFLDKQILAVIKSQEETPFLLVTHDPKMFNGFILSFAINYTKTHEAIEVVLDLQEFGPVVLEEQFFITENGVVLFGEEAEMHNNPLFNVELTSKEIH